MDIRTLRELHVNCLSWCNLLCQWSEERGRKVPVPSTVHILDIDLTKKYTDVQWAACLAAICAAMTLEDDGRRHVLVMLLCCCFHSTLTGSQVYSRCPRATWRPGMPIALLQKAVVSALGCSCHPLNCSSWSAPPHSCWAQRRGLERKTKHNGHPVPQQPSNRPHQHVKADQKRQQSESMVMTAHSLQGLLAVQSSFQLLVNLRDVLIMAHSCWAATNCLEPRVLLQQASPLLHLLVLDRQLKV